MFAQTLYTQWKGIRDFLAFYAFIAFVAPLVILWVALPKLGLTSAVELVRTGEVIGVTVGTIAVVAGLTVAWQSYAADERVGHVYALSLPVTRARLLTLRLGAAAIVLMLPALAVWIGSMLAIGQAALPPTLHGYAGSLAGRVVLASWLAHACMFALRYSAGRRARLALMSLLLLVGLVGASTEAFPSTRTPIMRSVEFLGSNPGPFGVIFGRWTLIDV